MQANSMISNIKEVKKNSPEELIIAQNSGKMEEENPRGL
jgi:hypothetical protein